MHKEAEEFGICIVQSEFSNYRLLKVALEGSLQVWRVEACELFMDSE
jgi:hypothetical protein